MNVVCSYSRCGKTFSTENPKKRYCNRECSHKAANMRHNSYKQERRSREEVRLREKNQARLRKYGITVDDYNEILRRQNGHCALCPRTEGLGVDHDHSCCPKGTRKLCGGCNRGLLCNWCNRMVGLIEADWGIAAIEYIARWSA